ncbi:NAD(P)-dependent oxidoreductase [Cellulomonas chengniuliangii]|uniref:NAD(P)-dependent oxidoreductase n=1 Tax=Cellulomonas chengniuliangii TaxID=2968084 RepID=A0ABY5KZI2_9CELL|nr:NAD(P)-dependent oxidoreductase [Cellulomonas chengniuliangii]MCC2309951.1 NAD(P)-dependent oxidoreductase [Cellulomonas chengniuliangii]UUI74646.1 NAD(P)-dependent oxidoreductase [Cellulomonas chengniuliangii]
MADIGFIGLGVMGRPMAGHVLDGVASEGRGLVLLDSGRGNADALIERGATGVSTARAVAEACDLILVMLPDLPQLRGLLDGPDGLVAGLRRPTVLVICSTVSPDGVRELDAELAARTDLLRLVDAPVSGGEIGAVAGTMSIMVGGPRGLVDQVMPVLSLMGTPVHLGPLGAGQVAKACNQLICAAQLVAIAEAAVVAERAGLDVGRLLTLLQGGYAASTILADKATRFAEKDYRVSGAAKFMVKDLAAYRAEADRTTTRTVIADRLHEAFSDLTALGMGDQDTSVVQAYISGLTGEGR